MINQEYRAEILKGAYDARVREVTEYQVNIDNFRLAIERIGGDPDLQEYKQRIERMLVESLAEIKKAKLMLAVVESQL